MRYETKRKKLAIDKAAHHIPEPEPVYVPADKAKQRVVKRNAILLAQAYRNTFHKLNVYPRSQDVGAALVYVSNVADHLLPILLGRVPALSTGQETIEKLIALHTTYKAKLHSPTLRSAMLYGHWAYHPDSEHPSKVLARHLPTLHSLLKTLLELIEGFVASFETPSLEKSTHTTTYGESGENQWLNVRIKY